MSMQAFYAAVSTEQSPFESFALIAQASLKQVLAVRSELAWDVWKEAKAN